jgi:hypothetical protein
MFVDYKTFQSKEDAMDHCLNFGKQLIDRGDFKKYGQQIVMRENPPKLIVQ